MVSRSVDHLERVALGSLQRLLFAAFCHARWRVLATVFRFGSAMRTSSSSCAAACDWCLRGVWRRVHLVQLGRLRFADGLACQCYIARVSVLWLSVTDNTMTGGDQASFAPHTLKFLTTPWCSSAMIVALFDVFEISMNNSKLVFPYC